MKHEFKQRMIYKDTDAEGVVYYANYLRFFERGRMELLRENGISIKEIKEKHNVGFAVTKVEADYHSPAMFDDVMVVKTVIEEVTPARIIFKQEALRDGQVLVSAKITSCAVSLKDFKPTRIPKELFKKSEIL